jgi:hypothetical protein|tara:strand:- start:1539 stop:1721 length:183 start_codon:yes stop_codon:yes gene_type:complete
MRTQEETQKLVASLPRDSRQEKIRQILTMKDGQSVNAKVTYLVDYCGIEFMEVYQVMVEI